MVGGVSAWSRGGLPGLGGVCLVTGGCLPGPGGVCLVPGGFCLVPGALPGPRGVGGSGIPACSEADTLPPPLWTDTRL